MEKSFGQIISQRKKSEPQSCGMYGGKFFNVLVGMNEVKFHGVVLCTSRVSFLSESGSRQVIAIILKTQGRL